MSDPKPLPVLIVKPKTISRADIKRAEEQGFLCIIECKEPESARFLEPPVHADIGPMAEAAVRLMRIVLSSSATWTRGDLAKQWAHILLNEQMPKPVPPVKS